MWNRSRGEFGLYNLYNTAVKSTHKLNDRQTPQVTPWSATLPCQNTMVILTSWESTVQDQLTPKYPIKHKSKTSALVRGSRFTSGTRPAFSPLNLQGVWVDGGPIRGERGLEMKYVLGGCDCPRHSEPHLYLIPSSRVCNHEVNQHDTRASITQAPFGLTCLLLESIQGKKQHIFQKMGSGHGVGLFQPISSTGRTMKVIKAFHLSL